MSQFKAPDMAGRAGRRPNKSFGIKMAVIIGRISPRRFAIAPGRPDAVDYRRTEGGGDVFPNGSEKNR